MTRISPARNIPQQPDPDETAIVGINTPRFQLKKVLLWLLRISAIMCMARGINYWMELIGLYKTDFNDLSIFHQIAIIFFACVYCFAATGLWMTVSWGVVLWVIALIGEAFLIMFEPSLGIQSDVILNTATKFSSSTYLILGIGGVASYLVLSWIIEREDV